MLLISVVAITAEMLIAWCCCTWCYQPQSWCSTLCCETHRHGRNEVLLITAVMPPLMPVKACMPLRMVMPTALLLLRVILLVPIVVAVMVTVMMLMHLVLGPVHARGRHEENMQSHPRAASKPTEAMVDPTRIARPGMSCIPDS